MSDFGRMIAREAGIRLVWLLCIVAIAAAVLGAAAALYLLR